MTSAAGTPNRVATERVAIGERLGFYEVMSEAPATETELAKRTGAAIGVVAHWLADQAREGYLVRDKNTGRYANWCSLPLAAYTRPAVASAENATSARRGKRQ